MCSVGYCVSFCPLLYYTCITTYTQIPSLGSLFSSGSLAFFINKTDRHDIAEILLKVALSTTNLC